MDRIRKIAIIINLAVRRQSKYTDLGAISDLLYLVYSPAPSYRSPSSSATNLSDYDRGIRKFNGLAAPLDVVSLRAIGVTHSDPTTATVARARANAAALLIPGNDNVRAASTSVESIVLPEPIGGLVAAFQFPGQFGLPDGSVQQKWKKRFGAEFTDEMGVHPSASLSHESTSPLLEMTTDDKLRNLSRQGVLSCHNWRATDACVHRRRSISNIEEYSGLPVLEKQYMQTDVEIAYQYVLLREKEARVKHAAAILEVIVIQEDSRLLDC